MKVISVSVKMLPHPMAVQAASFIVVNQGLHRFIFQNITLIYASGRTVFHTLEGNACAVVLNF
jgi:hypothetical protein